MVDRHYLAPNESVVIDTTNNNATVIKPYGVGFVEIRDANNNLVASLDLWDMHTLPINSGTYTATYTGTSEAIILVVREFIY
ncbi:MAG: hypothetical protein DSY42_09760 [Aquifex sp.]|nr:MAG: hypothetical protein DSY42_09760 [Aquifex sp.]